MAGLTGRDPNANVNVLQRFHFRRLFSLRTKSLTLICIYADCNTVLLFTSRVKNLDFFLLSRYVWSRLLVYQDKWFVSVSN